jgi:hypothetical protein
VFSDGEDQSGNKGAATRNDYVDLGNYSNAMGVVQVGSNSTMGRGSPRIRARSDERVGGAMHGVGLDGCDRVTSQRLCESLRPSPVISAGATLIFGFITDAF